ncbi:uncharacterized protein [Dermacentor albipictus]|uniref:uncharacterized protein n=1 Tax=Dermacentor albipictus TaxID=60249 RepID=UPI0038FCEEB6
MVEYDPNEPWPLPMLALFLEIREKRGFHQIYPNGFVRYRDHEVDLLGEFYDGWTGRVFMCRSKKLPRTAVHTIYDSGYFCKTEISRNETSIRTIQKGVDPDTNQELGVTAKAGDIYSMGIRVVSGKYFQSVANEKAGPWMNMKTRVKTSEYKFKIWSREDVILSVHLSEERENNYKPLPEYYDLPKCQQPPGSTVIALLECQNPEEEIKVAIDTEGKNPQPQDYVNYGKVPSLKQKPKFFVYVRNLPEHYTVATSFSPEPRRIAHKSAKDNIYFHRPTNCSTVRLTHYIIMGAES